MASIPVLPRHTSAVGSMPLSPSGSMRVLKHTRAIQVQAYAREDGLWDIEAHITDTKTRPTPLMRGIRAAGDPIHDLSLRITIDTQFNILEAEAVSDGTPYPGSCDQVGPQYQRLVGLNLVRGFRHAVRERLGGVNGCTHLTELTQVLPTAAIQAFAGDVIDTVEGKNPDGSVQMPFQLGKCRALRTDGPVVAQFYPRWAVANADNRQDEESPIPFQSASIRKLA
jgi:hypothetical protein